MKILLVSDYKIPSGYHTIAEPIATRWANLNHDVMVLGSGYAGEEHRYPFAVIPTQLSFLPLQVNTLSDEIKPDWVVFLMDVEKSNAISTKLMSSSPTFHKTHRTAAIFPVESDPLTEDWAAKLFRLYLKRFTFTNFGVNVLSEAGIEATKVPVGLDPSWYEPADDSPVMEDGSPYILSVADNQLRKNLPDTLKIFKLFREKYRDYKLILVTRPMNPVGWDLIDLINRYDIKSSTAIIDSASVSRGRLKRMMNQAKCVLSTALAEGIGLPIYEAQSQGTLTVGTRCCGITEAITDEDLLVAVDKVTVFNWGTSNHYWPKIDDAVEKLGRAVAMQKRVIVHPTWEPAAEQIVKALDNKELKLNAEKE